MSEANIENTEVEEVLTSKENKECEPIVKEKCVNNDNEEEIQTNKDMPVSKENSLNVEKQEESINLKETDNNRSVTNDMAKKNEKSTPSESSKNDTCLDNKINTPNRVSRLKVSGFLEIVNLDENESMETMLGATFVPTDMKLIKNARRKRLDNYTASRASGFLPLQMSSTGTSLLKSNKTTNSLTHMQSTNPKNAGTLKEFGKDTYKTLLSKKPYVSTFKMTTFEKIESDNAKKQLSERLKKQTNLSKGGPTSSDTMKNSSVSNTKVNAVNAIKENIAADTFKTKPSIYKKKTEKEKIQKIKTNNFNRQVSVEFHRWPSGEARKSSLTEATTKPLSKVETVLSKKPEASIEKNEMNTILHNRSSSLHVQSQKSLQKPIQKNPLYLQSLLKTKKVIESKDLPQKHLSHKSSIASTLENNITHQIHPFEDTMHSLGRRTLSRHDIITSLKYSESSNKAQFNKAPLLLKNSYLTKKTGKVELHKNKNHSIQVPKLKIKKLGYSSSASAPPSAARHYLSISKASLQSISKEDKNRYQIRIKKKKHPKQKNVMSIFDQSGKLSSNSKPDVLLKKTRDLTFKNHKLSNKHIALREENVPPLNKAFVSPHTKVGQKEKIISQPERKNSEASGCFVMKEHPCLTILHQEGDALDSYIHVAHKDALSKENESVLLNEPNRLQAKDTSLSKKNLCTKCGSTILPNNNNSKPISFYNKQDDLMDDSVSTRSKRKRDPHACRYSDMMHQQSVATSQHTNASFPPLRSNEIKSNIQLPKFGDVAVPSTQLPLKYTPSLILPQFIYNNAVNWSQEPVVKKAEAPTVDPAIFKRKDKEKPIDQNLANPAESQTSGTPVSSGNICQRCCFYPFKPC